MFTRIFTIITVFLLISQIISAQKIFQQPKTISQVVGKINFENKEWAYSPYVKIWSYEFVSKLPNTDPGIIYRRFEQIRVNYLDRLSFFCRQEYKFEKSTKIPLRFRLGSLNYTNYLERKPNALKTF